MTPAAAPAPPVALLEAGEGGGDLLRRFDAPVRTLRATAAGDVPALLDAVERAARDEGLHAVGYVAYEAAPAFDAALAVHAPAPLPLAWFALCRAPALVDARELERAHPPHAAPPPAWASDTPRDAYVRAVHDVRARIGDGAVYQVNLTTRLRAPFDGDALALWLRLRRAQPSPHAAWLDLGDHALACASPELFVARAGDALVTRPMKGTAPRGRWRAEDDARAAALAASPKERAENVMIVDLLRNDLGRVAATGSVRVPALFTVERYPTVLQLTSTVEARARPGTTLADLFAALFPCGSVTGAPKVAAMGAIAALERAPRGAYCGAVGELRPGGDARFAVAIRTVWVDRARGVAEYGVGGGVTWDSTPEGEHAELRAKAAVLDAARPPFALLETLRLDADGTLSRLAGHLTRLTDSAAHLGVPLDADVVRAALLAHAAAHAGAPRRVRLTVAADGGPTVASTALGPADGPPTAGAPPRRVALARTPVRRDDRFLYHKTTHRATYDARRAEHPDAFDVLLWNERGEVTEFTIGNVVVELDGARVTPPRDAGLLAGVFRAELLATGQVAERVVRVRDLPRATRLWLVNAVREWVPVALDAPAAP